MFALTLVSLILLAGQARASAIVIRDPVAKFLQARQTSGFNPNQIPQQCQTTCAGTAQILSGQGCQTASCLCTSAINTGFQQCFNCILALGDPDPSLTEQSQEALAQYEDACAQSDLPLSSLSLSGAGSLPTSPAGGGGGGGVSIPNNSNSIDPSIFFSPSGSAPTPSAASSTIASAGGGAITNTPTPTTPTRSVITAVPSQTNTDNPSPSAGNASGNGNAAGNGGGVASGGERAYVTISSVLGAGLVGGAMMVLGL